QSCHPFDRRPRGPFLRRLRRLDKVLKDDPAGERSKAQTRTRVAARSALRYPARMPKSDDTPLMQQWRDAKARHPDALIFFRVGGFYEMFCEDAEEGARLPALTLTSRNSGGAADVPLAGVPARARDEYIERLIRLGRRVAICEQVEDPAEARGIVRREVLETVTPGAVLADSLLAARRNNFLVALRAAGPGRLAIAAADIST